MSLNDYFYSKSLDLYISKNPLTVSSRVLKAAASVGLSLEWDEDGCIHRLPFHETKLLLEALGSVMLTPCEFALVVDELKYDGDLRLLDSMQTDKFTEWLNIAYRKVGAHVYVMENPTEKDTSSSDFSKFPLADDMPYGRPAWFQLNSSELNEQGFPMKVEVDKPESCQLWKYWSVNNEDNVVAAMRGFVLSSGTCSLDLDIPTFARHPKIMIRECRKDLKALREPNEHTIALYDMLKVYQETLVSKPMDQKSLEVDSFFSDFDDNQVIINNYLKYGVVSDEMESHALEESIYDILGKHKAYNKSLMSKSSSLDDSLHVTKSGLLDYLKSVQVNVSSSLLKNEKIVFVAGHKNPDADAIISSLFEAYRRFLIYKDTCAPVVLGGIPKEVSILLGDEICSLLLKDCDELYQKAERSGLARWVLVDWHEFDKRQFVDAVIDHHIFDKDFPYYVAVSKELNWSSTLQVYAKILGSGILLDQELSHLLLVGTLLEAEYSLMVKVMGYVDRMLYNDLLSQSGCISDKDLYTRSVMPLLTEKDPDVLFDRDYKQSHPLLGFSVIKQVGLYSASGECLNHSLVNAILERAISNNLSKNIPLSLIKIVDYDVDGVGVNCEEILCVFNENWHDKGFKQSIMELLEKAFSIYHGPGINLVKSKASIKATNPSVQVPRLLIAPLIKPIIDEHGKFFYSKELQAYISRGFYDGSSTPYSRMFVSDALMNRCNHISYFDMKALVHSSCNTRAMSLAEYWKVYEEAESLGDKAMVSCLRDGDFVELLDTYVFKQKYVIDKLPYEVISTELDMSSTQEVTFLKAHPGLIKPLEVDSQGLPIKVHSPDNYGDPSLWRYWAPDVDHSVACRGHIFLLNQTSIDLKIPPNEKHENMGFRPIYQDVPDLVVRVKVDRNWLDVSILPRTYGVY